MLPDDQVHPDTHVLTMVNNVIAVVNYMIAARPSPLNFVIADNALPGCGGWSFGRRMLLGRDGGKGGGHVSLLEALAWRGWFDFHVSRCWRSRFGAVHFAWRLIADPV